MSNLMLHCGAQHIERPALYALPDPKPLGNRHHPIRHDEFVETVESSLKANGFNVTDMALGLNHESGCLFGVASVEVPNLTPITGTGFTIGFRGSDTQRLARELCAGSSVFVCDNLAFSATHVLRTKHTTGVMDRLPALLQGLIEKLSIRFENQNKQLESYRSAEVSATAIDAAVVELGRRQVVNWSELGKLVAEYDAPSYEEHNEGGNVWRLFNAATQTLKPRNPQHPRLPHLASKTVALHDVCDRLALAA